MTIKLGYKAENFEVDSNNISQFELLESKRKLREPQVRKIKMILASGGHFDAPLVVNKIGSVMRVIDGMHRITAIEQAMNDDQNLKVQLQLAIYRDLTSDQEKEIFNKWNKGTKQSSDDYVKMYEKEIPILNLINNSFVCPVSIYKESGKMHFKLLTGSYLAAKNLREGGFTDGNEVFVTQVKSLGQEDYNNLTKFMIEFLNVNNSLDKNFNVFLNTSPFNAIMYLYHWNVLEGNISGKEFWNRFSNRVKVDRNIASMSLSGGISATKAVQALILQAMNRGVPTTKQIMLPASEQDSDDEDSDEELDS